MPEKRYRDKFTGNTYSIPWDDPTRNPTDDEIESLINIQKRRASPTPQGNIFSRAYNAINKPLTTFGRRTGKALSDKITTPRINDTKIGAMARGFYGGALEGLGDIADDLTNPIDLASTVLTGGAFTAARRGYKGARRGIQAASALTGARGATNIADGLVEDIDGEGLDTGKIGAGALELSLSALGANQGAKQINRIRRSTNTLPDLDIPHTNTRPEGPVRPDRRRLGTGTTFKSFGDFVADARNNPDVDSQLVKEAERYGISQDKDGHILSRRSVYNGPGNKLPDIDVKPIKAETVIASPKPKNDIEKLGDEIFSNNDKGLDKNIDPIKDLTKTETITVNPLEKMDDKVLEILKNSGNKDAIKELARRKGETGSINIGGFTQGIKDTGKSIKDTVNLNLINSDSPRIRAIKPAYQKWVNDRAARKGISFNVKKDFADLEPLGMEGVFAYNSGERGGRLSDVQKWFDEMHTAVSNAGIKLGFKENYLPQIWDNSSDEIKKVFGNKRLTLKPGIAFKSIIDTYQEGIKKGLTPKYKSIPDLMGYYSEVANKAIADRQFFKYLRDNKMITTRNARKSKEWKALDQDIFPTIKTKDGNRLEWHAPPEIHDLLDNYLRERRPAMKKVLRGIQITKDMAMASGVPGTAFNAHGANMLARSGVFQGIKGFTKAIGYMANPGSSNETTGIGNRIAKFTESIAPWDSAAKVIDSNRQIIPDIMKHGGRLGVEGHEFNDKLASNILGKTIDKVTGWHKDLFETHLFDKMIPAVKIDYWKSAVDDLIKTGMPEQQAKKEASRAMNLAFAGINYDELATDKNIQDLGRMFLLAPDWYASSIGISKNVIQSFLNSNHPGAKLYRNAAKGLLGTYAIANVMNAAFTGYNEDKPKMMFQNESGRTLDIDTGSYTMNERGEKKKVYISPLGTAFDAFKIPFNILNELGKDLTGKDGSPFSAAFSPLRNRLSLPARSGANILLNTDNFGRRIHGRDIYGNDIEPLQETLNVGKELANPFVPSYAKAAGETIFSDITPLEALSQATEAPFRFTRQRMPRKGRKQRRRRN